MLYMGNVNRIIFWALIPLLLVFFLVFRVVEWQLADDRGRKKYAEQHTENISNSTDINCLILGGSNAVFSLSAEQISNDSNLNCYNISLLNEGFSDVAYFDFIRNLPIEHSKITTVLYSSIMPLSTDAFTERLMRNENFVGISGETDFQLMGKSIASYLIDLLQGKPLFNSRQYPTPNSYGDFRFELYDGCDIQSFKLNWIPVTVDEIFKDWLENNIQVIKGLFSSAEITLVLPSTLRTNLDKDTFSVLSNSLQAEAQRQSVRYIEQSSFNSINLLCDDVHHANAIGREIRTDELMSLMQASN